MLDMLHKENKLEKQLDRMDLRKPSKWTDVDADQVDFPQLSEDAIRELTLGVYQVKQARSYVEEKKASNNDSIFTVQVLINTSGRGLREASSDI
ncbi:unnamed protein product [Didymodactylos carnosus]|uniref:Uncharacterized protein n=2 Tax=Didymodactylos carnosus TaxID=1234261 RepID=A0A815AES0_9BILA|nr:unnamed protein product [Didymodactylos carnosus]CAF4029084.1 unnamed protein product [Didymodactylos carnosus]